MKVNRQKFLEQLEAAYPAIAPNPIVPHYSYFKISERSTGLGDRIQAFDGTIVINVPTEVSLNLGHDCAIPAESFLKLLRSLDDEEIELTFQKDKLKVVTDEVQGTFTILDKTTIKQISISGTLISDKEAIQDLLSGFKVCRLYASKDQTAGPMRGVKIDEDKLIATDRYRVIIWRLDNSIPVKCSIPLKFIDIVLKNKDDIKELLLTQEGFTAILNAGTVISTMLLAGEYPDVLKYFPAEGSFKSIKFTDEIAAAIERHVTFLSQVDLIDKEIWVQILKDKCITKSKVKDERSLVDEVNITSDEDLNIEFLVNPVFLKDIVNICSCFKYYPAIGIMVLEADKLSKSDKLQYLTQVRENE